MVPGRRLCVPLVNEDWLAVIVGLREAGWRPPALFASATVVNIVVALGLAAVLFGSFTIG